MRIIARSTYAAPTVIRLLRNGELIARRSVDLLTSSVDALLGVAL